MIPQTKHDEGSLKIAYAALAASAFAVVAGLTHLNAAARFGYPGRGCVLVGGMIFVSAVLTITKIMIRRRNARRLDEFEDARLSSGQRSTKEMRGVKLGRHLFDVEADRIPDGEQPRDVWLDGRTIGPAEESDDPNIVGIYQTADPMPPLSRQLEGNRHFLAICGLAVLVFGVVVMFIR